MGLIPGHQREAQDIVAKPNFHGPLVVQQLFLDTLKLLLGAIRVAVFQSVTSELLAVTALSGSFGPASRDRPGRCTWCGVFVICECR